MARARVTLGTLVEIALPEGTVTPARFDAAFAAIAAVERCMSAHDPAGDLARIAAHAHRRAVRVDPHTARVLGYAIEIAAASDGLFDVTVAPELVRHRQLPSHARGHATGCGRMWAIRVDADGRVCTSVPVALDLGGIAKGYAVDCAIDALRACGASSALVNAGGDLRVIGDAAWYPVRIRHPVRPTTTLPLGELREQAIATSAGYYAQALIDPRVGTRQRMRTSVSVVAPTCMIADALTKVIALDPDRAPALLARHAAQAFIVRAHRGAVQIASAGAVAATHLRAPLAAAA